MSNVIPFPNIEKSSKDNAGQGDTEAVRNFIIHVANKMGLNDKHAGEVYEEYWEIHKEIFKSTPLSLRIPREAGLTEDQIHIISIAQQEAVVDYASFHQKKISKAAHALIGVMIREKLRRL